LRKSRLQRVKIGGDTCDRLSASEVTYIVSGGALNSTHSLTAIDRRSPINYWSKSTGAYRGKRPVAPVGSAPTCLRPDDCAASIDILSASPAAGCQQSDRVVRGQPVNSQSTGCMSPDQPGSLLSGIS